MKRTLRACAAAFSYFTILPVARFAADAPPGADAIAALPLTGVVVGAMAGGCGTAVWLLSHSKVWTALAAWILAVTVSGAIHIDGFLDACDGVLASAPPERRVEIMRDPLHGTYAVVGMTVLAAVWIAAIASLPPLRLALILAFSETLGRTGAVVAGSRFSHLRTGKVAPGAVVFALAIVAAMGWFVSLYALAVAAAVLLVAVGLGAWMSQRLGGALSGDCYGAIVCICNVVALVALSLAQRGGL